jgi:hypothetical protein
VDRLFDALRTRLLPAVLTAAGVTLIAAGLLSYSGPVSAGPGPSFAASPEATMPPRSSLPTMPPLGTASPSASPEVARIATRVVIRALRIDLPVVKQPDPSYPSCNIAMYYEYPGLGQPGQGVSTYLYAHARRGMFLALLDASKRNNGRSLLGMPVEVYTSDNQVFLYEITQVRPRVPADEHWLDDPLAVTEETLWLQTSTGPGAQYPKLQVVALPLNVGPASVEEAQPVPKPVDCA